jgi:hypothetical protein
MSTQAGESADSLNKFYVPALNDVPAPARTLLEEYSKISAGDVLGHVLDVVCFHHFFPAYVFLVAWFLLNIII